jgi:hypothetical protein
MGASAREIGARDERTLTLPTRVGSDGLTWQEMADHDGLHHREPRGRCPGCTTSGKLSGSPNGGTAARCRCCPATSTADRPRRIPRCSRNGRCCVPWWARQSPSGTASATYAARTLTPVTPTSSPSTRPSLTTECLPPPRVPRSPLEPRTVGGSSSEMPAPDRPRGATYDSQLDVRPRHLAPPGAAPASGCPLPPRDPHRHGRHQPTTRGRDHETNDTNARRRDGRTRCDRRARRGHVSRQSGPRRWRPRASPGGSARRRRRRPPRRSRPAATGARLGKQVANWVADNHSNRRHWCGMHQAGPTDISAP